MVILISDCNVDIKKLSSWWSMEAHSW